MITFTKEARKKALAQGLELIQFDVSNSGGKKYIQVAMVMPNKDVQDAFWKWYHSALEANSKAKKAKRKGGG